MAPKTPTPIPAPTSLTSALAKALELVSAAVDDAAARVVCGPDNPAIRRHSTQVTAFSINFSELGKCQTSARKPGQPCKPGTGNWDPFFYDWKAQYRYAQELLEGRKFGALRSLLTSEGYRDPSRGFCVFAPEVIAHIKAITGDLQEAISLADAKNASTGADINADINTNTDAVPIPGARRSGAGRQPR